MKKIRVALAGQPNVGKSSIINSVTGARLHVGNFSGVTVEKKEVFIEKGDYEIEIIDLPGIYSLNAYTPEEHVAKKYLYEEDYDLIVNVVDANTLSRNLIFTMQLMDMQKKMILVVNMIDEIEKQGGEIDRHKLEELLGKKVDENDPRLLNLIEMITTEFSTRERRYPIGDQEFKLFAKRAGFDL